MHSRLAELGLPVPLDGVTTPISPPSSRQTFTKIQRTSTPHVPRGAESQDSIGTDNGEYIQLVYNTKSHTQINE